MPEAMILVLTGPVHSGKTSLLGEVVTELRKRGFGLDGFLSPAIVKKGETAGYDLFDIKTGKSIPFLRKMGREGWPKIGPYFIIPKALDRARQKILSFDVKDFLVVDEVGPLELRGEGIWPALSAALERPSLRCLLVVRHSILRDVLDLIGSDRAEVIDINENRTWLTLLRKIADSVRKTRPKGCENKS